ncbi:amidase [Neptuniibacter sp. 2_MG-2023]|uniref:amidase family protein n=1 Tax=Neptuniibacter sp. 2_MG-2023 TaxID=3062671 RepID=UPI0026E30754|nr:amidase [Neptuniibacter sp. 2_MG-2023]MDO6514470.1 amidase [Neptuniibacter sp. 2_MG-2023]
MSHTNNHLFNPNDASSATCQPLEVNNDSEIGIKQYTQAVINRIQSSSIDAFSTIETQPVALSEAPTHNALSTLPLKGMCFAVKEVIDAQGYVCNLGCQAFTGRIPMHDADIVQQLQQLGAQLVGITRSTEMAIAKETSTVNPWHSGHTPGGSSSGSAAAVGAGLLPFALGTQTIGSIIRPAAYCGAVGFKPSKSIGSLTGVLNLSTTLDHLGYFADSLDRLTTTLNQLYPNTFTDKKALPFKVLLLKPWFAMDDEYAWQARITHIKKQLKSQAIEYCEVSLDQSITSQEEQVTHSILCYEMYQHWGDTLLNNKDTSEYLQSFLTKGKGITKQAYQQSLKARTQMETLVDTWLNDHDIIVFPSVTGLPPKLGDGTGSRDTQRLWTLLGMPAINLPIGFEQGFPTNVQLIAKRGQDQHLLAAAAQLLPCITATQAETKGQHV